MFIFDQWKTVALCSVGEVGTIYNRKLVQSYSVFTWNSVSTVSSYFPVAVAVTSVYVYMAKEWQTDQESLQCTVDFVVGAFISLF